jgi:hypothetical protein
VALYCATCESCLDQQTTHRSGYAVHFQHFQLSDIGAILQSVHQRGDSPGQPISPHP